MITGDKTQIDLPRPQDSGLLEIEQILSPSTGSTSSTSSESDVVRHRLVKDIIRAYANHDNGARQGE